MPDWQKFVRELFAELALDEREKEDVVAEFAGHLEDTYEALRRQGLAEGDAVRRAFSQVRNWNDLQRKIRAAKDNPMNARTSRLWLPSLVTLTLSMVALAAVGFLGLRPGPLGSHSLRPHQEIYIVSDYTVWLTALPFVGALGARLSRRAGGSLRDLIASGVSPALAWLTVVLIVLLVAVLREQDLQASTTPFGPLGIITVLALIPAACLLLGVLAYNRLTKMQGKTTT